MTSDLDLSDLTLVIPAYNEEQRLPKTLEDAKGFLDSWGINYRVIVVDDGSHDRTAAVTSGFGDRFTSLRQSNGGKGSAVRKGILAAQSHVVAFTDADLPYDLSALRTAYDKINANACEVVYGSRVAAGTKYCVRRRWVRTIASSVFRSCMSVLVSRKVTDTQCGLKVFSHNAARKIFSRTAINGFAFDAEVVFLTHRLAISYEIIPVTLVNEYSSTISLTRNAFKMLIDVLGVRYRAMSGKYAMNHDDIAADGIVESYAQLEN